MLTSRTIFGALALLALGCDANARIICREGFQVLAGREISTPYCNDNYVAEVARARGFTVTNEAVRDSPSLKNEICRRFGSDIRIAHYCNSDDGRDRGR